VGKLDHAEEGEDEGRLATVLLLEVQGSLWPEIAYLPVLPTIATFSPESIESEKSWITGSPAR
jgi:hypothetical protein